jgi:hypothetical protein
MYIGFPILVISSLYDKGSMIFGIINLNFLYCEFEDPDEYKTSNQRNHSLPPSHILGKPFQHD